MARFNITDLKEQIAVDQAYSETEREFLLDAINEVTRPTLPRVTALLDPGYELKRIKHIWAFLSSDRTGEGVCAAPFGGLGAVPLIAADDARMESLRPLAQQIALIFKKQVRLVKFTGREDVETIAP